MSWANEWRPKKFKNFFGQKYIIKIMKKSIIKNDLHNSYLFTGPSGTGKTTIARIFSKSLNCVKDIFNCNICNFCKSVDKNICSDIIEIDASKNRGLSKIESLVEDSYYLPSKNKYKIFILDEFHMLTNNAFSLMLKLLEEPPSYIKFILISTDLHKIPLTIISRCLHFTFNLLNNKNIALYISKILIKRKIFFKRNALWLLTKLSNGNMRNAVNLIQKIFYCYKSVINFNLIVKTFYLIDEFFIIKLFFYIYKKMNFHIIEICKYIEKKGLSFSNVLLELIKLIYNLILLHFYSKLQLYNFKYKKRLFFFAKNINLNRLLIFYEIATIGYKDLNVIFNQYISFTMIILKMFFFDIKC